MGGGLGALQGGLGGGDGVGFALEVGETEALLCGVGQTRGLGLSFEALDTFGFEAVMALRFRRERKHTHSPGGDVLCTQYIT